MSVMAGMRQLWEEDASRDEEDQERLAVPTVVDDLPLRRPLVDGELFIIRNCESRYLTHVIHKYAGKFIPHIPRWALHRYLPRKASALVLDPFVGSGTTLLEAYLYGQHGYGVDVDPLARLITKVKTTAIPEDRLATLHHEVMQALDQTPEGAYRPGISTLAHWFAPQAVAELSAIYDVVERFRDEPDVYDFLLVCFSAIIRRASNADNQTMKTYVSHTNPKKLEPALPLFTRTLSTYIDRLIKFGRLVPVEGRATVFPVDDAQTLDEAWRAQALPLVDLAITSPPYIKSVDYIYNQMVELFWIGDRWGLEDQTKQNVFKERYIGHDRVTSREAAALRTTGVEDIDAYIAQIHMRNQPLGLVTWRYFDAMGAHLASMGRLLRPGAHYVIVVGDSTLAGVAVPTHDLIVSCAVRHGFATSARFAYEIRNKYMHFPRGGRGGGVEHDWVIDLVFAG